MLRLLTWDRVRPLGESGGPSVGKGGECDVESQHLQGCSLRLCHLRTDGLASMSKYWMYWSHAGDMCLVNWYSLLPTDAWLFPTTSMTIVGEKLDMNSWISQPACCGLGWEPFLLGAVDPFNTIDDFMKGYHVWGLPAGTVWVTYVDWRGKRACCVHPVSPIGCTLIWITATLRYE
jgi:hypothetical protein